MPEPIVIIGATRPGGPAGESAENATETNAVGAGVKTPESRNIGQRAWSPLLPALGRMAKGVLALASGTFWALAKGGLYVASRYPRHSLAAGASIVILGAVLYTQLRSGKGAPTGNRAHSRGCH